MGISPRSDDYREYRDGAAIKLLNLPVSVASSLADFWPPRGAVWDALGRTSAGRPVLMEAKAHIPEAASGPCRATPASMKTIRQSLDSARRWIAPRSKVDWTESFYQYANRIAFQHFLRERHGQDSVLVFLYFTNAVDMSGPATVEEWHGATRLIHALLGLPAELSGFGIYHAFLDARDLLDR